MRLRKLLQLLPALLWWLAPCAFAQTNLATLTTDGAWTWFNDPRALFHNGSLYFGYVRADGKVALNAFNPTNGSSTSLWISTWTEKDDHDNPGLLSLQDGRLLAIYARHGGTSSFSYRTSLGTNPVTAADWGEEQTFNVISGVTYANPYQLSTETGRVYNFMRNLNFNPTVTLSTDAGASWSTPQLLIQAGTGGTVRPYVKYSSNYSNRIDLLYTDGHPRNLNNSLYHAYYNNGAIYKTDGALLKNFADIPLLHDSGERGSVIYQYSDAPSVNPDSHLQSGRAWCWEIAYQSNGAPACVFTVQRDNVTGTNWFDDRIYYYYARWTGTQWQKRFIAQAGRPLYASEDDYAGGICIDPKNPNIIYISSNAADPFNLADITNIPLQPNSRYELYRGVTTDGGLTFSWTAVTTNSTQDNLRPYIPRNSPSPTVIWFSGTYSTYTSYNTSVVGLFSSAIPKPPQAKIIKPSSSSVHMTNLSNNLVLSAEISDDGLPGSLTVEWSTVSGPTNAVFSNPNATNTTASFLLPGSYILQATASDSVSAVSARVSVTAGHVGSMDVGSSLWLKLDESSGTTALDTSGNNNEAAITGGTVWQPSAGKREGALQFDGASGVATVNDSNSLDGTTVFSLTYWFRANAYPVDSGGLVSKRDGASLNNAYTTYLKTSDRRIYVDIDGSNNRFSSSALINTGLWYHVALTFDGSLPTSQRVALWINGSLDTTASESSVAIPNYPSHFRIGNTHAAAPNWFGGSIDDVRFYRRKLIAGEITTLAQTNFAPSILITAPSVVTNYLSSILTGSISDDGEGGTIAVGWSKLSGAGTPAFSSSNTPTTSVTFNKPGPYNLELSAGDSQVTVSQNVMINVAPNTNYFDDWIVGFFPGSTDSNLVGAGSDPDNDGVKNIVEFALGMNASSSDAQAYAPGQPGLPIGFMLELDGTNYLALRAQRAANRSGITLSATASSAFSAWTNALEFGSSIANGDGTETVTYRDVLPASQQPMRFLRLQVAIP